MMRMQEWVRANTNGNTKRTYDSGFSGFQRYLLDEGVSPDKLQPADIADYLRIRLKSGVAASTLAGDRAAIGNGLKYTNQKGMHGSARK